MTSDFPDQGEAEGQPEQIVCEVSIATLLSLGAERGIDQEKVAMLAAAIRDFAANVKPEPKTPAECWAEKGRCFTVPGEFLDFCDQRGVEIARGHYQEPDLNLFHQVNVFECIVVDWTYKQYYNDIDQPYPLVYDVDDPPQTRTEWGPLRGLIFTQFLYGKDN